MVGIRCAEFLPTGLSGKDPITRRLSDGRMLAANPDPTKKLRYAQPWSACRNSFGHSGGRSVASLTVTLGLHGANHKRLTDTGLAVAVACSGSKCLDRQGKGCFPISVFQIGHIKFSFGLG